jgi:MFS family permease
MNRVNTLSVRLTLLIVSTLTVMAGATIAPSLPAMRQFFSEVPNADYLVRLVLTAPALLIAIGAPFVGVLIDKLGRKPLLIAALLVYGLAGSSGLWFSTLELILVERAFLGVSVAGVMITATALIADYYTGPARGQFLGLQSAFMALGGVTFLSVGGFLADLKWHSPFEIYLVALVLILCVLLLLPEPPRANSSSTPPGLLQEEGPPPFPIPLVTLTYGIALLTQIVFYLIPVQLPFYLKSLFNAGASQSGLAIAFCTLFSAISSLSYQRIKSRLNFISIYGVAFANGLRLWIDLPSSGLCRCHGRASDRGVRAGVTDAQYEFLFNIRHARLSQRQGPRRLNHELFLGAISFALDQPTH